MPRFLVLMAGQLIDTDPELAYAHAEAARRRAARLLNFLERANGRKIIVELCDLSTFTDVVIWGNAIVFYPSRPGSASGQKSCIATSRAVGHASASLIPLSISFFAVSSRVLSALATCS